jgi:hypothetical protein
LRAGGQRPAGHSAAPEYVDEQAAGQYYRGGPEDGGRTGCRAGCARGYRGADFAVGPVHRRAIRRWTQVNVAYPASSLTQTGRCLKVRSPAM